jgi:hypothetical protein
LSHVYFTDRDLGRRFPEILSSAGLSVERHDERFGPGTPDEEWLADVGTHGRIAITHDSRIRYKPNERAAVHRHRVVLLVVVGKAPFAVLGANFVATYPRIEAFLARHRAPLIAKVHRPTPGELAGDSRAMGTITLWDGGRS